MITRPTKIITTALGMVLFTCSACAPGKLQLDQSKQNYFLVTKEISVSDNCAKQGGSLQYQSDEGGVPDVSDTQIQVEQLKIIH